MSAVVDGIVHPVGKVDHAEEQSRCAGTSSEAIFYSVAVATHVSPSIVAVTGICVSAGWPGNAEFHDLDGARSWWM